VAAREAALAHVPRAVELILYTPAALSSEASSLPEDSMKTVADLVSSASEVKVLLWAAFLLLYFFGSSNCFR
jgi:hypothetical protein